MPEKPMPPTQLAECGCGRIGYAMVLCQEHAPIPYELTPRGRRDVRHMRQWDAIFGTLLARQEAKPASAAARKAWATRKAKAARIDSAGK